MRCERVVRLALRRFRRAVQQHVVARRRETTLTDRHFLAAGVPRVRALEVEQIPSPHSPILFGGSDIDPIAFEP